MFLILNYLNFWLPFWRRVYYGTLILRTLDRVTKVKVLYLVLVYVFNFNLFEFSAAILEKGLLWNTNPENIRH